MKEYGGYLEFENFDGRVYHTDCLALNTGRNCLRYLIRQRGIKRLAVPYYVCDSVTDVCQAEGVKIVYYSIDSAFQPIFPADMEEEYVYVVNYYGQLDNAFLGELCKKHPKAIIDNAQAFFQQPISDVDTIYTCRKFFGVPDGAYLYTHIEEEDSLSRQYSYDRLFFLAGRHEKTASEFYDCFIKNEEYLGQQEIRQMSWMAKNILCAVDYDKIKRIREENYQVLESGLSSLNELKIQMGTGPYMYPLLLNNGGKVRKKLQEHKLYIPCLWPNVTESDIYQLETYYAQNILPIPCDQRYQPGDMEDVVAIIKKVLEVDKGKGFQ